MSTTDFTEPLPSAYFPESAAEILSHPHVRPYWTDASYLVHKTQEANHKVGDVKRPLNRWVVFKMMQDHGSSETVSEMWKRVPEAQKKGIYQDAVTELKAFHTRAFPNYKYHPIHDPEAKAVKKAKKQATPKKPCHKSMEDAAQKAAVTYRKKESIRRRSPLPKRPETFIPSSLEMEQTHSKHSCQLAPTYPPPSSSSDYSSPQTPPPQHFVQNPSFPENQTCAQAQVESWLVETAVNSGHPASYCHPAQLENYLDRHKPVSPTPSPRSSESDHDYMASSATSNSLYHPSNHAYHPSTTSQGYPIAGSPISSATPPLSPSKSSCLSSPPAPSLLYNSYATPYEFTQSLPPQMYPYHQTSLSTSSPTARLPYHEEQTYSYEDGGAMTMQLFAQDFQQFPSNMECAMLDGIDHLLYSDDL